MSRLAQVAAPLWGWLKGLARRARTDLAPPSLKRAASTHMAFAIALCAGVVVLWKVPQVANVLWPEKYWYYPVRGGGLPEAWVPLYGVFVALLLAYYGLSLRVVVPRVPARRWRAARGRPRRRWDYLKPAVWVEVYCRWVVAPSCRWLVGLVGLLVPRLRAPQAPRRRKGHPRLALAAPAVLLVLSAWIAVRGARGDSRTWYTLDGALCRSVGVWAFIVAAWLALVCYWDARAARARAGAGWGDARRRYCRSWWVLRLAGRVLAWLIVTGLVGEVLWVLAATSPRTPPESWWGRLQLLASYRLFTVWAVVHFLAGLIVLGQLLDRCHLYLDWPVRPAVLLGAVFLALWFNAADQVSDRDYLRHLTTAVRRQEPSAAAPADGAARKARDERWFEQLEKRIDSIPAGHGPAVIVACSGGGSRAAIFAALALETLARTPLPGESIKAILIDPEPGGPRPRTWGDNVVLISAVSGGSLASAHYAHRLGRVTDTGLVDLSGVYRQVGNLKYTGKCELIKRLLAVTEDEWVDFVCRPGEKGGPKWDLIRATAPEDKLRDDDWQEEPAELSADGQKRWVEVLRDEQNTFLRGLEARPEPQADREDLRRQLLSFLWCYRFARRLDEAGGDLAGLDKLIERDPWEYQNLHPYKWVLGSPGFDAMCMDFMAPLLRGAVTPTLSRGDALAQFWTDEFDWWNSTNFRGYQDHNYQGGFREQHPALLLNACDATRGSRLVVGFPALPRDLWSAAYVKGSAYERPQSFTQLFPDQEQSLSRGVRMSSNFPWGLCVQSFTPPDKRRDPTHVLDGGVVDNTGLDTVYALFDALRFHAGEKPRSRELEGGQPTYPEAAKRVLAKLRDRKVVIVEVDAGAKPALEIPDRSLAYLLEPGQSLNNAAYTNAAQTKQLYIDETKAILAHQGEGAPVINLTLACNHYRAAGGPSQDVMTAWALGPQDKAQVVFRFLIEMRLWYDRQGDIANDLLPQAQAQANLKEAAKGAEKFAEEPRPVEAIRAELPALKDRQSQSERLLWMADRGDDAIRLGQRYEVLLKRGEDLKAPGLTGEKKKEAEANFRDAARNYQNEATKVGDDLDAHIRRSAADLQKRLDQGAKASRDAFDKPPTKK